MSTAPLEPTGKPIQVPTGRAGAGRQTLRFRPPYRQAIKRLTQSEPRLEDLVLTFPGLLFALATGYGRAESRRDALERIDSGASLRQAAECLGVPWWMRYLPPEAFAEPLYALLDGPEVQRRIVNHIPPDIGFLPHWLRSVMLANAIAGESFALWLASRLKGRPRTSDRILPLAAWAWFSSHPETRGHALVRCPFEPAMSLRAGMEEADTWRKRIDLDAAIGDGVADVWYDACTHAGLDFVPLRTTEDFILEAGLMDNCLDQFAPKMVRQATRIVSVRRAGRPVADLEIGPHEDDASMPVIEQLRGPANRRVNAEVWQAVYGWLARQTPRSLAPTPVTSRRFQQRRRGIWQPLEEAVTVPPAALALRDYLRSHEVIALRG
ncbi:MAG: hypothetical protein R3D57_07065 [Hyphomicrobiaceae bacterium]